jgi:hypothetical protein
VRDRWIKNVRPSPRHSTRRFLQPVPKRSQISRIHSPSPPQEAERMHCSSTYYIVSGGPVRITCHSKGLDSSTSPAEKPLSVFLLSSVRGPVVSRMGGSDRFNDIMQRTHAYQFPSLTTAESGTTLEIGSGGTKTEEVTNTKASTMKGNTMT